MADKIPNRENFEKLATYLEQLPADYDDFRMEHFFAGKSVDDTNIPIAHEVQRQYALHNGGVGKCGAVACALGHGPSAGILFPDSDRFFSTSINGGKYPLWAAYSNAFFADEQHPAWDWCFSGSWAAIDDTHFGAAARIRCMLDRGVPDDFDYDYLQHCFDDEDADELMAPYQPYLVEAARKPAA